MCYTNFYVTKIMSEKSYRVYAYKIHVGNNDIQICGGGV